MGYFNFAGDFVEGNIGNREFFNNINEQLIWDAISYLEDILSQENNAEVLYQLGDLYYELDYYEDSVGYFSKAADSGHVKAMYRLGIMYTNGFGLDKNLDTGLLMIHKAADKYFCVDAMYYLGHSYYHGLDVEKDRHKGLEYLIKAAEQEHPKALWELSRHYRYDKNNLNMELAVDYAERAYLKVHNETVFRDFFPDVQDVKMCNENIGGVTFADVVRFQVKLMMGTQYKRVKDPQNENDIIVACLRVAWNDAFRHVTKNKNEADIKNVLETKNETLDDYICKEILGNTNFLEVFIKYANSQSAEDKVNIIENAIKEGFLNHFQKIKEIKDTKSPLCFGHIQKLFNMALKYYLCLYFCREFLWKSEAYEAYFFDKIKKAGLEKADCPVDSIILKEVHMSNDVKWSKIGNDIKNNSDKYIKVQNKVKEKLNEMHKVGSNLQFDFEFWNK